MMLAALFVVRALSAQPGEISGKAQAEQALQSAISAKDRHASAANLPPAALQRLQDAQLHCRKGRFDACTRAAKEAHALFEDSHQHVSQFAVEVQKDGSTQVRTRSGKPVTVTARGEEKAVPAGEAVTVTKEGPPSSSVIVPLAPGLKTPADAQTLRLKSSREGLGPVTLAWDEVQGASSYEVTVQGAQPQPLSLASREPALKLPPLPPGSYRWSVRARGTGNVRSDPSEERTFELAEETLKLEVKGGQWK